MSFDSLLNAEAYLLARTTSTADKYGMDSEEYIRTSTPFLARLQPGRRSNVPFAGPDVAAVISSHRLFARPGSGLRVRDRIEVSGRTFDVLFVADAAGHGHHDEADLLEVVP